MEKMRSTYIYQNDQKYRNDREIPERTKFIQWKRVLVFIVDIKEGMRGQMFGFHDKSSTLFYRLLKDFNIWSLRNEACTGTDRIYSVYVYYDNIM